jgi:hypothetical protein
MYHYIPMTSAMHGEPDMQEICNQSVVNCSLQISFGDGSSYQSNGSVVAAAASGNPASRAAAEALLAKMGLGNTDELVAGERCCHAPDIPAAYWPWVGYGRLAITPSPGCVVATCNLELLSLHAGTPGPAPTDARSFYSAAPAAAAPDARAFYNMPESAAPEATPGKTHAYSQVCGMKPGT